MLLIIKSINDKFYKTTSFQSNMFGLFNKGKIEIKIDNYNYSPGDVVEGQIKLILKKPFHARGLFIRLLCKEKISQGHGTHRSTRHITAFNFKQIIDGEKEYSPAQGQLTYEFKIKIPVDVNKKIEGTLGKFIDITSQLSGRRSMKKWYLKAYLDLPMKIDISKKVQINLV